MTEAIVSAVVQKLAEIVVDEVRSLRGVDSKVNEVKVQLGQMQCFLKDAESTKKRGDERIKGWVRDVRNVAYETEDAFDTFLVEANRRMLGLKLNGLLARHNLNQKIFQIQSKLSKISESRTTFGIQDLSGDGDHSQSLLQTQPNSFKRRVLPDVDNSEFVGFEDEKGYITNLLLNGLSNQSRYVISIVGSGGLGKTTLAQKVYSCPTVRNHFDSRLWITVSQDFNLLDVLKKIHQKLTNETEWKRVLDVLKEMHQEDQIVFLLEKVNTLLKEKKYLIVLDDVWTEHVFTKLETGLVDVGNGSRVLMTTRKLNVANYADSRGVYHLRLLSEEEGWVLFLKKAFRSSDPSPECPEELKDLARKLVKRCNGLPLAVIVLGGLLSSKPCTQREWSGVLERLDWHTVGQGECMKILASSYNDLSYQQKSCFRYLACFPEDYTIKAKDLMNMWIAEGLIEAKNKGELEDYAEDYLEELVQRCLVQVVERSPDGAIKSIWVHDLLREVALGEAKENDFFLIWKNENAKGDVSMTRRLALHDKLNEGFSINQLQDLRKIKLPRLRTFINFEKGLGVIGTGFLLLRVLELRNARIKNLPTDLKNMIHLRYLGLRGTDVTVIPSWIGHLQNLQSFYITGGLIRVIPESFWEIPCLRHVQSSYPHNSIVQGPSSTANLVNLRSLGWFIVPKSWKESLPNLPGVRELQLRYDNENDRIVIHNLMSKLHNLLSVSFFNFYPPKGMIDFSTSPSFQNIHTMFLSGYNRPSVDIAEMPPNLAKVHLDWFIFKNDPMRKLEKLRGLKCLEMERIGVEEDTIVCTNGGFPALQNLTFSWGWIEELKVENGALPVLKYLHIEKLDNFALPGLQCVTTLQELHLNHKLYPKFTDKSGKEWDNVKHIPTITEITKNKFHSYQPLLR
ncbi:putative disease resistance RPP13-like protein 3 [Carex rostrata]